MCGRARARAYVCELTASVSQLPGWQAGQGLWGQEGVCVTAREAERFVMHFAPRQDQGVTEQEEAEVAHLLENPESW